MAKIEIEVTGTLLNIQAKQKLLSQIAKQDVDILEKLVLMNKPKAINFLRNSISWAMIKNTLGV